MSYDPDFSAAEAAALRLILAAYPLPESYLVLDVETSGLTNKDVIVDIGWVLVQGGEIAECANLPIDWSRDPTFLQENGIPDLAQRMATTKMAMEARGQQYPYSWEALRGAWEPTAAFRSVASMVRMAHATGVALAGHNFEFDRPRIHASVLSLCDIHLPWDLNNIVDTGMIQKGLATPVLPFPDEPGAAWRQRVRNLKAKGVFWNLSGHCVPFYEIGARYNMPSDSFHGDSRYDCLAVHYLIDTWRKWSGHCPAAPAAPVCRDYRYERPLDLAGL